MRAFVQFLTRNQIEQIVPLGGKEPIKIIDDRKPLKEQIVEGLELCEKHPQTDDIVGFNIVEVDSFQNKENIAYQNIYAY